MAGDPQPPPVGRAWASLVTMLDAHRPHGTGSGGSGAGGPPGPSTPVTLLTGFLGAGKSTLLARLLTDPATAGVDGPVRAVVNDIGSLPIDPTLVAEADGFQVELTNGCGCCQATGELGQALDRAGQGAGLVVLEASGIADPLALGQVIQARPGLRLDRIVAVVDPLALPTLLDDPYTGAVARRQLEAAGTVIVSHGDRLGARTGAEVPILVAEAAPGRPIGVSTLASPLVSPLVPGSPVGAAPLPGGEGPPHRAVAITAEQRADLSRPELDALLERARPWMLRGKGRLQVDSDHVWVQVTPSSISLSPAEPGPCELTVVTAAERAAAPFLAALGSRPVARRSLP